MTKTDKQSLMIFYISLGMIVYCLLTLALLIYAVYLIIKVQNNWSVTLLAIGMVLAIPYLAVMAKSQINQLNLGDNEPED